MLLLHYYYYYYYYYCYYYQITRPSYVAATSSYSSALLCPLLDY